MLGLIFLLPKIATLELSKLNPRKIKPSKKVITTFPYNKVFMNWKLKGIKVAKVQK